MDLSKIPEPSEDDLSYTKFLLGIVDCEKSTYYERVHASVIAHILRHGRVLAKRCKVVELRTGLRNNAKENEAITFFE